MAIPALSVGSYSRLRSQLAQYRAITGRDPSPQVLQALMEAEVGQAQQRSLQESEFALRKESQEFSQGMAEKQFAAGESKWQEQLRQINLDRESQSKAAKASGAIQVGKAAIQGIGLLSSFGGRLSSLGLGTAAKTGSVAAVSGAGGSAGGAGAAAGAGGSAGGAGAAAGAGEVGLMGVGGAGALGGYVGSKVFKNEPEIGGAAGGAVAGGLAAAGTTFGSSVVGGTMAGGPIGAVVGAVVGLATAVIGGDGSIVCTELNRQGYLSDRVCYLDHIYRMNYVDRDTYDGYLKLFSPLVKLMKRSKFVTIIVKPFGVSWAIEMASRMCPLEFRGSLFGKFLLKVGVPICRFVGRRF